jgi:acyl-CoA synthetase (AMP-forming)/AMP-acid ligase II
MGEEVAAFVVADGAADEAAILRHCRASLAAYKVPGVIRTADALPRNNAGKVIRATLTDWLAGASC